jgi:hypothetical protein
MLELKGLVGTMRMIAAVPAWCLRKRFFVLVKDLQTPLAKAPVKSDMDWTLLTVAMLPRVLAVNPSLTEQEIRRRWGEDQTCHLCWVDGEVAHYRWETQRPAYLPYLGKTLRLCDGDILITEAFTHARFRNRGIHTTSSLLALDQAKELGSRRVIGLAACWNSPALCAMQKAGRKVVGTVGYWRVLRRRFYFASKSVQIDDRGNVLVL